MGRDRDQLLERLKANRKNSSSKDVEKVLLAFGFVRSRTRGSHEFWQRGSMTLTLVLKNPVKVGYVNQIVRMIGEGDDERDGS